ncbi:MAG: glycosyltransferase, partial [Halobacteriaceae archaeon]
VLSPSQFVLDLHRDYGLFNSTDQTVLPYGLEKMAGNDSVTADEALGKAPSEGFRLLFVGQLTAQKGALWLVDAIDRMDKTNLRLDVLGKGPQMEEINNIAAGNESIHAHGFVTGEQLDDFYKRADATVVSSKWYDNSPMVIYESYSHGTPVIGAEIGGIPELIDEGVTGFLFDPNDRSSLQEAIRSAIKADREQLRRGVEEARTRYTMVEHLNKLMSEYESTAS